MEKELSPKVAYLLGDSFFVWGDFSVKSYLIC